MVRAGGLYALPALLPGTTPLRSALHTQGAHLHTLHPRPHLPPSPGAHTTDVVAVVSGPQTCRLESGHPVLCGCSSAGGGAQVPLQKAHAEAPSPCIFIHTHHIHTCAHAHVHTDRWKARWPWQAGCSETPSMGTVHPSVAGPLEWGKGGRGSSYRVPSWCLSSYHYYSCLTQGWPPHHQTFPLEEALRCLVLSKPQDLVRGVPRSASVGLFVCSCAHTASPGNILVPCSEHCRGSPVLTRSSSHP